MIQWKNSESIKINNINTSAIIEDASDVLQYFSDKYIVTKYKISTGDLVEYAGITYIVISQIDRNYENRKEEQYNYRARIRQADFTIKIVLNGKVEIFPSIIEGQTFNVVDGQIVRLSGDKIIVILKASDITNAIEKNDRFIKLNQAWEIIGIDLTKKGLTELFCKSGLINNNIDDVENEIANKDKIDGTPTDPEIPTDPDTPIELKITGSDYFTIWDENELYTVNTDKPVLWSLDRDDYIMIDSQVDNKCFISSSSTSTIGETTLKVELIEDSTVFDELLIKKFYQ